MTAPAVETTSAPWLHPIAIVLLGLACYGHVFGAPFVFDDHSNITQNPYMKVEGFDLPGLATAAFESRSPRPVANFTLAVNHALCGLEVRCYRAVNVVVHLANGLLVYALGSLLLLQLWPGQSVRAFRVSWVAAAIFVAHPIQIQAVTYVVQRMTSLATLFYLLALWLWLRGRLAEGAESRAARRRDWSWAAACAVFSFGSKQIAVTLPFAIGLVEWLFFQQGSVVWLRRHRLAFAGLCAAVGLLGVGYLALIGFPGYDVRDFTLGERLLTQLRVVPFYVSLLLLPLPGRLSLIHHFEPSTSLFSPLATAGGALFLVALLGVGLWAVRRERLLAFAVLWFFLQLGLESSVLPLEMAYEHRLYLPMVAVALALAEWLSRLPGSARGSPVAFAGVSGALVLALAVATWLRNETWNDAPGFWYDAAEKAPRDERVYVNLVYTLRAADRLPEAEPYMAAVVERRPELADAWNTFGIVAEWDGRRDDAAARFAEAARRAPDNPVYRMKQGSLLAAAGDLEGGIASLEATVRAHPEHASSHFALGTLLEEAGRIDAARAAYRETIRLDPKDRKARPRLVAILGKQSRFAEAAQLLREMQALAPHDRGVAGLLRQAEAAAAVQGASQ